METWVYNLLHLHFFINEILELISWSSPTSFSAKEMRRYLESFAIKQLLDPLNPKTWYMLQDDITSTKVIHLSLSYFTSLP